MQGQVLMGKPKYAESSERGRLYTHPRTGEIWPSVTNVLDTAISKPALVPWAAKVTAEAFWSRLPEAVKVSMNGSSARDSLLRDVKAQVKFVKDSAADLGTRVHDAAESLALQKVAVDDDEVAPYAAQVIAWMDAFGVNIATDVLAAEATILNRKVGFAGTGDLWVLLRRAPDGTWTPRKKHLYLVDYKSSSTRPVNSHYPEVQLQLAALAAGEKLLLDDGSEVDPPGPIVGTAVLNLRRDCYGFIPMPADRSGAFEAFAAAVKVTHFLHSVTAKYPIVEAPSKAN